MFLWPLPLQREGPGCAIKGQIKDHVTPAAPEGRGDVRGNGTADVVLKQLPLKIKAAASVPGLKGVAIESVAPDQYLISYLDAVTCCCSGESASDQMID